MCGSSKSRETIRSKSCQKDCQKRSRSVLAFAGSFTPPQRPTFEVSRQKTASLRQQREPGLTMSSLWLRKLALAGATLAPTSLAFSHYTQKPSQSSTALRATPLKQCVGGSWVESSSKATIDVEDPTTGALIGKVPEGTAADAHAALVAAKEAQPAWGQDRPGRAGRSPEGHGARDSREPRRARRALSERASQGRRPGPGGDRLHGGMIRRPARGVRLTTGAAMACWWDRIVTVLFRAGILRLLRRLGAHLRGRRNYFFR